MKITFPRLLICFATATTILFGGCTDNLNLSSSLKTSVSVPGLAKEMVITPFGKKSKSKVHLVEKGFHIRVSDGHIRKIVSSTGVIAKDYNLASELATGTSVAKKETTETNDGWIVDTRWVSQEVAITYFSTNWIVPSLPTTNSGQTLFLFNALDNEVASAILQPVLQFGPSDAGGGPYWSIGSWLLLTGADSAENIFYSSYPVIQSSDSVAVGTNLQGVMTYTGESDGIYNYTCGFVGYPDTFISLQFPELLNVAYETLETYGAESPSDYPPDDLVKMTSIEIKRGTQEADIIWAPRNWITTFGQHVDVVNDNSPHGEIDLYFRFPVPHGITAEWPSSPFRIGWVKMSSVVSYDVQYGLVPDGQATVPFTQITNLTTNSYVFPFSYGMKNFSLVVQVRAHYESGAVSEWSSQFTTKLYGTPLKAHKSKTRIFF